MEDDFYFGEEITKEKLEVTEKAERILFDMGFRDFRVRMRGSSALVQIAQNQQEKARAMADDISSALAGLYDKVTIDENPRVSS